MAFFEWDDKKYSVGVKQIDEQHQRLVAYVNGLYDAMAAGEGKAMLGEVLYGLIDYTQTHFADEEKLMAQAGYPELPAHRQEHKDLIAQVAEFQKKFKSGEANVTLDVMDFLKNWLNKHILGSDKRYGPALNAKGIR